MHSTSITRSVKELYISESSIISGDLRKLSVNFGGRVVKLLKATFVAPRPGNTVVRN